METTKQVWGMTLYAIGGGLPSLTLYETQEEAEKEARAYNDKEDWTASVRSYTVPLGLFAKYPVETRPGQLFRDWEQVERLGGESILIDGEQWIALPSQKARREQQKPE